MAPTTSVEGSDGASTLNRTNAPSVAARQGCIDLVERRADHQSIQDNVARMEWTNVMWTINKLRVPDGKTDAASREIGMSSRVVALLERRLREQSQQKRYRGTPWVFPSSRAKAGHIVGIAKAFRIARRDAGLPDDLVLYSARHTFGTEFMNSTKDLKLTMSTMGHVDVKTAMRYQHPETAQVSNIIDLRNAQRTAVALGNGHSSGHSNQVAAEHEAISA